MFVSAYNIAIGVEQRKYPWETCIRSALNVADEFCIAYDSRFDNPEIFAAVDDRVVPVPVDIVFAEWDFVNLMLTRARQACSGDWCLYLEMDEVLHPKDGSTIFEAIIAAEEAGREAVNLRYVEPYQDYVLPKFFFAEGNYRQKLTVNKPWLYHKTSDYMIAHIDSEWWDGRYIIPRLYDDFAYYDEQSNSWFQDFAAQFPEEAEAPETSESKKVEFLTRENPYVWHYANYNHSRKMGQAHQTAIWQDRTFGRTPEMDIPKLIEMLKEEVTLDSYIAMSGLQSTITRGAIPVNLEHPPFVLDWLDTMRIENSPKHKQVK